MPENSLTEILSLKAKLLLELNVVINWKLKLGAMDILHNEPPQGYGLTPYLSGLQSSPSIGKKLPMMVPFNETPTANNSNGIELLTELQIYLSLAFDNDGGGN